MRLKLKPIAESGIREAAFLQVQILTTFLEEYFLGVDKKHMEINIMESKDNFDSHLDSHHDKIFGLHALRIKRPWPDSGSPGDYARSVSEMQQ